MEKASFLFSGIHFDRKKFAKDFTRFQEKKEDKSIEDSHLLETEISEPGEGKTSLKKRKRKSLASETVEGFTVFKSSKSAAAAAPVVLNEENDQAENRLSKEKKELYRQQERDALSRKKYNIHVSRNNVATPLQSFAELSSSGFKGSYALLTALSGL
ncbi:hypothetical protein F2P56_007662 [Juglans regia]|uniref:Uncharacterized protein n=1 Tax=Juglans regia TaxID=51240 RepID=A0A833Y5Y4_JUGRE|nr:hypothetical protein F2P56_007662 [Juglans regia]